jgi:hypothetical protein
MVFLKKNLLITIDSMAKLKITITKAVNFTLKALELLSKLKKGIEKKRKNEKFSILIIIFG